MPRAPIGRPTNFSKPRGARPREEDQPDPRGRAREAARRAGTLVGKSRDRLNGEVLREERETKVSGGSTTTLPEFTSRPGGSGSIEERVANISGGTATIGTADPREEPQVSGIFGGDATSDARVRANPSAFLSEDELRERAIERANTPREGGNPLADPKRLAEAKSANTREFLTRKHNFSGVNPGSERDRLEQAYIDGGTPEDRRTAMQLGLQERRLKLGLSADGSSDFSRARPVGGGKMSSSDYRLLTKAETGGKLDSGEQRRYTKMLKDGRVDQYREERYRADQTIKANVDSDMAGTRGRTAAEEFLARKRAILGLSEYADEEDIARREGELGGQQQEIYQNTVRGIPLNSTAEDREQWDREQGIQDLEAGNEARAGFAEEERQRQYGEVYDENPGLALGYDRDQVLNDPATRADFMRDVGNNEAVREAQDEMRNYLVATGSITAGNLNNMDPQTLNETYRAVKVFEGTSARNLSEQLGVLGVEGKAAENFLEVYKIKEPNPSLYDRARLAVKSELEERRSILVKDLRASARVAAIQAAQREVAAMGFTNPDLRAEEEIRILNELIPEYEREAFQQNARTLTTLDRGISKFSQFSD